MALNSKTAHSCMTFQLIKTKTAGTQEGDNAAVKQFRIIWLGFFLSLGRDMVYKRYITWSSLLGALQVRGVIIHGRRKVTDKLKKS